MEGGVHPSFMCITNGSSSEVTSSMMEKQKDEGRPHRWRSLHRWTVVTLTSTPGLHVPATTRVVSMLTHHLLGAQKTHPMISEDTMCIAAARTSADDVATR